MVNKVTVSEKMFDGLTNYHDCTVTIQAVTQSFADDVLAAIPSTAAVLLSSADIDNNISKVVPSPTFTLTGPRGSKEQDMPQNPIDSSTASVCFAPNQIALLSTGSDTSNSSITQSLTSESVPSTRACASPVKMGVSPTRMRSSSKNISPSIQLSPAKEPVSPSHLSPKMPRLGVSALAAPPTTLLSVSSARSQWSSALSSAENDNVDSDTTHSRSFFSADEVF